MLAQAPAEVVTPVATNALVPPNATFNETPPMPIETNPANHPGSGDTSGNAFHDLVIAVAGVG
jgi:hypothetical protein